MRVLVIGGGGREHTLVWKIGKSEKVKKLFAAPGNAGISSMAECVPIADTNIEKLCQFALAERIDLTVVGPEVALTLGIVDIFEKRGLRIFGPHKLAAAIEGSKAFAMEFMERHSIPTAQFKIFEDSDSAIKYIESSSIPLVVKADGLAAGKGSIVCFTREEALRAVKMIMIDRKFGSAGRKIVVEEYLEGEEASLLAISDGESFLTLPSSQDHKPIYDDDRGPNTGGMGAYAPAPLIDDHLLKHIEETIIAPTIRGMREEDNPFKGVLYAGLMITSDGPKVVEFNCRFGDPEAQAVLPLVDLDLMDILISSVDEQISSIRLNPPHSSSVCVVLASQGYPGSYEKGKVITGLDKVRDPDIVVFHAGTAVVEGKLVTNGGRVLGVTAVKSSLKEAVKAVYRAADKISFEGKYFRRDIGRKGLKRLEQN